MNTNKHTSLSELLMSNNDYIECEPAWGWFIDIELQNKLLDICENTSFSKPLCENTQITNKLQLIRDESTSSQIVKMAVIIGLSTYSYIKSFIYCV